MTTTEAAVETAKQTDLMDPSELTGKTRAELLEMCQARGLKASGWKRDRMYSALTGAEAPESTKKNVLADQLDKRREERETGDQVVAKALANRLKRTGRCLSTVCELECQGYEEGARDAFHWQLCTCGHTQWAHAEAEPEA